MTEFEFMKLDKIDIHDPDRIILFRHFVDLIVRIAILRSEKYEDINRNVEKLLLNKIIPSFKEI
jgi:hypothetical protein